jgi:hypothetical protein
MLAIAQFAVVGLSLDQILRKAIIGFNFHSENRHVPAIFVQVLTVTIFIVTGVAAYIGLYDHHLNYPRFSIRTSERIMNPNLCSLAYPVF